MSCGWEQRPCSSREKLAAEKRGLTVKTNKPCATGEKWAHLSEAPRKTIGAVVHHFQEQKKQQKKPASSMLKPNTKSLLPDRFGKRIISAAGIIFAAYIIEAYEGIEQEMELGQKPIYGFWGTLLKKRERELFKVLLKIFSANSLIHSLASLN